MTFIPNPRNNPEVNHINGIKTDNRISNLEWVTHKENMLHAWATGLHPNTRDAVRKAMTGRTGGKHNSAKKVLNTKTGVTYGSVKEAAISINMKTTTLVAQLSGQNTNRTNLEYLK